MKAYNKLPVQSKLLLLGVLPAAVVAITLAIYFTSTRLNDMYDLLHKTNQNLASSIAEASINSIFTGNIETLDSIISSYENETDVISISITDAFGSLLSTNHTANNNSPTAPAPTTKIVQAIQLKSISVNDDFDSLLVGSPPQTSDTIGYVSIAISYQSIQQRQYDILLHSFYITVILLIIIGIIARYISNSLGKPILDLAGNVKNITDGDYRLADIDYHSPDEISTLISGVQKMALVLEQHQDISAKKVSIATQELRLQNDKLFDAQEELIKAAREKSRFVSHISHEIRTPLNGIIGFLEIIKKTSLDETQTKLLHSSYLSAKNLHVIINEVLDLAQLEAGKVKVNRSDFNLQETIEDTLATLSVLAESNGVTVHYQHDSNAAEVINQDRVKFGQILLNLVGNAIKFSPNSTVKVSLKADKPKKNHIELCIQDQGIGISKKNINKLFRSFSQLDDATSVQGTGLGLAITKRILDALNGSINVQSTLGTGSLFCFSLPFSDAKTAVSAKYSVDTCDPSYPDLSSIKILVADDNEINRLLLTHLLEEQHAQVSCANDGQQAADLATSQDFDLMLLDLRMPFKMGNETLHEIRRDSQHRNHTTPAIAITAHITTGEVRANHISAFDGYLTKPIDHSEFFTLLEQLLGEHDSKSTPFLAVGEYQQKTHPNKVFDYERAKKNMNADSQLMNIIMAKFFSELPQLQAAVSADIKQEDLLSAAEIVHKIQGSCAYCAANALQTAAKQLEVSLRDKHNDLLQENYQQFEAEMERLLAAKPQIIRVLETPAE